MNFLSEKLKTYKFEFQNLKTFPLDFFLSSLSPPTFSFYFFSFLFFSPIFLFHSPPLSPFNKPFFCPNFTAGDTPLPSRSPRCTNSGLD